MQSDLAAALEVLESLSTVRRSPSSLAALPLLVTDFSARAAMADHFLEADPQVRSTPPPLPRAPHLPADRPPSRTPWCEQVWMPSLSEQRRSDPGGLGWTWSRAAGLGPMAKLDDELLRSVLCWTDLRTRCAAHSASKVPPNMYRSKTFAFLLRLLAAPAQLTNGLLPTTLLQTLHFLAKRKLTEAELHGTCDVPEVEGCATLLPHAATATPTSATPLRRKSSASEVPSAARPASATRVTPTTTITPKTAATASASQPPQPPLTSPAAPDAACHGEACRAAAAAAASRDAVVGPNASQRRERLPASPVAAVAAAANGANGGASSGGGGCFGFGSGGEGGGAAGGGKGFGASDDPFLPFGALAAAMVAPTSDTKTPTAAAALASPLAMPSAARCAGSQLLAAQRRTSFDRLRDRSRKALEALRASNRESAVYVAFSSDTRRVPNTQTTEITPYSRDVRPHRSALGSSHAVPPWHLFSTYAAPSGTARWTSGD